MRIQAIDLAISGFRAVLRCGGTLALLCSITAMTDDVPRDAKDSPERQAFLAGASKDCPGCDLRGVSLKRRDLSGADLTGADLTDAVLHAARLTKAKLGHAMLQGANLSPADYRTERRILGLRSKMYFTAGYFFASCGAAVSGVAVGILSANQSGAGESDSARARSGHRAVTADSFETLRDGLRMRLVIVDDQHADRNARKVGRIVLGRVGLSDVDFCGVHFCRVDF